MDHMDHIRIERAGIEDIDQLAEINRTGWRHQGLLAWAVHRTPPSVLREFAGNIFRSRVNGDAAVVFKAIDRSSDIIVGTTTLQIPSRTLRTGKEDLPAMREGMGHAEREMIHYFELKLKPASVAFGYDPEQHFHRRSTYVLEEYRGQGVGKRLSEACDKIVCENRGICYAVTNDNARRLFQNAGYEVVGTTMLDLSRWNEPAQMYTTLRRDFGV